jgi:hypothetical protein
MLVTGSLGMAAGLGLMSTMGVGTSQLMSSLFMVVLGVGMGFLMQTTNLVMQNSVEQRDLGAASGASTLFRTVGGSLGVSLLGVFYTNSLTGGLTSQVGAAQAAKLAGGQLTPATLGSLPTAIAEAYRTAVAGGVTTAFLWAAGVALVAIVVAWFIREVPLRGSAPVATPETISAEVIGQEIAVREATGYEPRHAKPEREPRHALADA